MIAKAPVSGVEAVDVDYDTLIIGAGISGINAAYRQQTAFPDKSYAIIEARQSIGGTWDLFKYPGIRSDSDLHTFGFAWKPWPYSTTIADAVYIKQYLADAIAENGIDKNIKFGHKLVSASWSTPAQAWSLRLDVGGVAQTLTCRYVVFGTGYYDYEKPLEAHIPGIENFGGQIIHPQFWPTDFDWTGKDIVVIGSGATAITLIPNLTEKAKHVTMLQRSPGFILSQPREDVMANALKWILPSSWVAQIIRLKWLILPFLFFKFCRGFPNAGRWILQRRAKAQLPKDIPIDPHFNPSYGPWEQRLCVCPSGDFYTALRKGDASIVTAHIKEVTKNSIILKDNKQVLKPDVIVTATGLRIALAGNAKIFVDNEELKFSSRFIWRSMMVEGVPNACLMVGYTNASWTLGVDASMKLFNRIRRAMDKEGKHSAVAYVDPSVGVEAQNMLNLNSTYVVKAEGTMPKGGDKGPWQPRASYWTDMWNSAYGSITDGLKYA